VRAEISREEATFVTFAGGGLTGEDGPDRFSPRSKGLALDVFEVGVVAVFVAGTVSISSPADVTLIVGIECIFNQFCFIFAQ